MEIEDIDLKSVIENETLQVFKNIKSKIHSPFNPADDTPSFGIYFDTNNNKWKFKDFSTGECGDAIDFIMKFKNMNYIEARKYLGLSVEKSDNEKQVDNIRDYIDKQLKTTKKGYELIGIFPFVDKENNVIYYKVKFLRPDGKKETPYYHIENGKVVNSRGTSKELPYNLYRTLEGIKENKTIIVVEGEKDANNLNFLLRNGNYVCTSLKNVKDFSYFGTDYKIIVIGDTGAAGEKYVDYIKEHLYKNAKSFKIVKLSGIEKLGDNKDITDWLDAGHTKDEFYKCLYRSLDLKNFNEIQQDQFGIYKLVNKKGDDEVKVRQKIADFNILEAKRVIYADTGEEGIKLKLRSINGNEYLRIGPSTVMDTIKDFKNFLGSIDLTLECTNIALFNEFKMWINKYFALEFETVYKADRFTEIDGKLTLVTSLGSFCGEEFNKDIFSESGCCNINKIEEITKEELEEVKNYIFNFSKPENTYSIIGTIINNLAAWQNEKNKKQLHHLLIVGESGGGKTTILDNVIAPILNYPLSERKSIGLITPFALQMDLSQGNYTKIYDEYKPSMMDKYKLQKISDILRNLYTRAVISRGNRSFTNTNFKLESPIIIAGEEGYSNSEKALIERSCIVYVSKRERTEEHTKSMNWLIKNESLLNKLGKSLISVILGLSNEDYKNIRDNITGFKFNDRIKNTAVNIACGIEILNILLEKHNIEKVCDYEKYISNNINSEILTDDDRVYSTVELMLKTFDEMSEIYTYSSYVKVDKDNVYIRTSEMIEDIFKHIKESGASELVPIKLNDFKKQAFKAGYIKDSKSIPVRFGDRTKRAELYDKKMLLKLGLAYICNVDINTIQKSNTGKVIQGNFNC